MMAFFDESHNLEFSLLNIQRDNFLKEFEDLKESSKENEDKIVVLQNKIDDYTIILDLTVYHQIIDQRFNLTKLSALSIQYLVSGQFLLHTIDVSSDFSPVILQYGRTIENEIIQLFHRVNPTKRWTIGEMQASLEKIIKGTTALRKALRSLINTEIAQITTELTSTFNVLTNLGLNLLNDLREIRNSAGHPGQTKTKQDANDYISKANDFLDKWIGEKK